MGKATSCSVVVCVSVSMVSIKEYSNINMMYLITDTAVTQWRMDIGADWLQNSSSYETSQ